VRACVAWFRCGGTLARAARAGAPVGTVCQAAGGGARCTPYSGRAPSHVRLLCEGSCARRARWRPRGAAAAPQDYCGLLSEEAVRKNGVLLYEVLDEVIDYGFPQNSSSAALREFVLNEPTVLHSAARPARALGRARWEQAVSCLRVSATCPHCRAADCGVPAAMRFRVLVHSPRIAGARFVGM